MIIVKIDLGSSLELLQTLWCQFSFRQFLDPAYTSQDLQAPSNEVGAKYRVLICCTCHFLCFLYFILASSVCWSLHCLVFALTQGGEGGHLFSLTCSVALWGGRNAANKYHWHVLTVIQLHWVCLGSVCALPQSTLLRLQVSLPGTV